MFVPLDQTPKMVNISSPLLLEQVQNEAGGSRSGLAKRQVRKTCTNRLHFQHLFRQDKHNDTGTLDRKSLNFFFANLFVSRYVNPEGVVRSWPFAGTTAFQGSCDPENDSARPVFIGSLVPAKEFASILSCVPFSTKMTLGRGAAGQHPRDPWVPRTECGGNIWGKGGVGARGIFLDCVSLVPNPMQELLPIKRPATCISPRSFTRLKRP